MKGQQSGFLPQQKTALLPLKNSPRRLVANPPAAAENFLGFDENFVLQNFHHTLSGEQ
ncbi:MAG: hypothetical protein IT258_14005 [Saprospiraceae bacterium]|nr:hypothetical protein [Saprospiraceae bacterium]